MTATDVAHFLGAVENLGFQQNGEPKSMSRDEFIRSVSDALEWSSDAIEAALQNFSLTPRQPFIPPGRAADVYPWRFGRDLSYIRRPIVQRIAPTGPEVLWGNRHLSQSGPYLLDLCLTGRLKASSKEMRQFIGRIRSTEPEQFNDEVAEIFEAVPDVFVRRRVKKIGHGRLTRTNGQDLGDIDVLVIHPARRRILAIETKDFEVARTPAELANEVEKLFVGATSPARLHGERVQWLDAHLEDLLHWLTISRSRGRWRVAGLIVVSRELMSPFLRSVELPVVSFDQLTRNPRRYM